MNFEYGEKLISSGFWRQRYGTNVWRYRIDPVPGTSCGCYGFSNWYKKMTHSLNERRMCFPHREYTRGKRSFHNLPAPWDDIQRGDVKTRKSWKSKRIRKQWMKNFPTSTPTRNWDFSKDWDVILLEC